MIRQFFDCFFLGFYFGKYSGLFEMGNTLPKKVIHGFGHRLTEMTAELVEIRN